MKTNIQERYRKPIEEFVQRALKEYKNKIDSITLFGSVARGEARGDSDIDVLVVWKGDKLEGWDALEDIAMDILLEYGQLISIKIIYPQEYFGMMNMGSSFIQNVKKEGVAIG
ncbi:MAG: nucleotidyltransferase domain-containing protein [Halobacteriota archaeon]